MLKLLACTKFPIYYYYLYRILGTREERQETLESVRSKITREEMKHNVQ